MFPRSNSTSIYAAACWFNSLFDEFREAMERGDFAGKEAQEAVLCVQLINTAYRSARNGSGTLPLGSVKLLL